MVIDSWSKGTFLTEGIFESFQNIIREVIQITNTLYQKSW